MVAWTGPSARSRGSRFFTTASATDTHSPVAAHGTILDPCFAGAEAPRVAGTAKLRGKLLAWYDRHQRDLPWRRTADPYAVWVSEVMLQQTRVETVLPYYERFLARWPTVAHLAAADPEDVRAAWSGLGYYRRARLMLSAAQEIARDHGGALPADLRALRALPGFGRYTSGAVASIAFGIEAAAVDGNVLRVLARILGIAGDVTRGGAHERIWKAAEELATGARPGDLNQALIELGALVCTPRAPRCSECPARVRCAAFHEGRQLGIPAPKRRRARPTIDLTLLTVFDDDLGVLLERQPAGGLFADLWCLPMLEGRLETDAIIDEAERKYGWALHGVSHVGETRHALTHREIITRIFVARLAPHEVPRLHRGGLEPATARLRGKERKESPEIERFDIRDLDRIGIPSFTARALRASLPGPMLAVARVPGRRTARAKNQASVRASPSRARSRRGSSLSFDRDR